MMMLEACTAHAALVSSESNGCINLETSPQSPIRPYHRPFRAAGRCSGRTISREMSQLVGVGAFQCIASQAFRIVIDAEKRSGW